MVSATTMYHTYYIICSLVLLRFCEGAIDYPPGIFLTITQNGYSKVYVKDTSIQYHAGENVTIVCNLSPEKENYELSWTRGQVERSTTSQKLEFSEILTRHQDGQTFRCTAQPYGLTISLHFDRIMSEEEKMREKPNVFVIILITLGILIASAVVILTCYGVYSRLRRNKSNEEIGLEPPEVIYATIDITQKIKNMQPSQPEPEDPQYVEIGYVNQSYDIKSDKNHQLKENDRQDILTQENDKHGGAQIEDNYIVSANAINHDRHGSSTDC